MAKVSFNNSRNDFYNDVKRRVDEYFVTNKIERTGNAELYIKALIFFTLFIGAYCSIIFAEISGPAALGLCAVLGFAGAGLGFSVMHDANHGSYSNNAKLNDFIGLTLNFLGANAYFWKQKHNIIHHTYTNVDGIDDDIAKSPIIRQCESQKWVPAHKVQHLYLLPVYSLSTIFWIYIMDFTKYFGRKIYTTDAWKLSTKNHITFWLTKVYYFTVFLIIPIYVWGFLPWLAGYFLYNAVLGLILSLVFQLAHVVENTEFEHIPLDATKQIDSAWAEHQVKTTANFAMGNKFINWYVGGLNFQIEHHLFPKVSHVHYPALSKIVQQECAKHNLPYNYYNGFWEALASHFRVMRFLGRTPQNTIAAAA